jgi:hypothetical protein
MVILGFEWEKASGFQLLVSGFFVSTFQGNNDNKFWVCVSRDISLLN